LQCEPLDLEQDKLLVEVDSLLVPGEGKPPDQEQDNRIDPEVGTDLAEEGIELEVRRIQGELLMGSIQEVQLEDR